MKHVISVIFVINLLLLVACNSNASNKITRSDGAHKLNIVLAGSLQNPAFSPNRKSIVFTRFRDGYNKGASDLFVYHLDTGELKELVSDGSSNVNLPGSSWNSALDSIVFSSDRGEHDEIYTIASTGKSGDETQISNRIDKQSFEPSYSPDGEWIVFESHRIDIEEGVIIKYRVNGSSEYIDLTSTKDNGKQPNWSPLGDKILYQKEQTNGWAIWSMGLDGESKRQITANDESATDAIFSPDGKWIIYSSENKAVELANIYAKKTNGDGIKRLTDFSGYDGAVSISPDASQIVFESSEDEPDKSNATTLWLIDIDLQ